MIHYRFVSTVTNEHVQDSDMRSLNAIVERLSRSRLLVHISTLLLFLLWAILMTWPLVTGLGRQLASWGDPVFQAWTLAWDLHSWRTHPLNIFDANIFYPYRNTLAYSDYLFGQAALISPLLLKTGNAILADNVSLLLSFAFSGFAMYLMVVDLTGNRLAGIVAGFAYAFAPARMAQFEHLHLTSAEWLPLAVLAARRALSQHSIKWSVVLGGIVVLQGLFGIYYFYFLAILLGVVFGAFLVTHRDRSALIGVARAGAACLVGAALLIPILIPYQQVHDELGIERTVEEMNKWRAVPSDYLAVSPRNRYLGDSLGNTYSRDLERDLFPGYILIVLAVFGLFNRRLSWERWMLFAVAVISIVLSFGLTGHLGGHDFPLPYRFFYYVVPGFKAIRVPARLGLLALVGLAGLAGLGLDLILGQLSKLTKTSLIQLFAASSLSVLLVFGMSVEYTTRIPLPGALPATLAESNRPDYAWLAQHPAPTVELPMGDGIIASAWPNFWSTFHWNPVVNGYSGIAPPVYYIFRDEMKSFPSKRTIALLQGIGVRNVVYHADPSVDPTSDPFLVAAGGSVELTQAVGGPDYVFELAPDPWIWNLVSSVPDGKAVTLPNADADAATFGMLAAILQRQGHPVYGNGNIDYWNLPSAPSSVCYAVMLSGATGTPPGFENAVKIESNKWLLLYKRAGCD
ncbi:MAG: hypothetical protein WBW04_03525 [Nitrolancea sp.]